MILKYDKNQWQEVIPLPKNTLQVFITNRCNLRCKGCFMDERLGSDDMSFYDYTLHIMNHSTEIKKVIMMGGEPTLHPELPRMIEYNRILGLSTTIYTNGSNLEVLKGLDLTGVEIRVGVYGATTSEKPLINVKAGMLPITIVYMLRKDNINYLSYTADLASCFYNCKSFYISSIRDIAQTHDYWKDTEETVAPEEYAEIVQEFVNNYQGNIPEIHISRRGVLTTETEYPIVNKCRFGNIFTNGEKIICPLDISLNKTVSELSFGERPCDKKGCILQKIVLRKIT
jgi:hypothetical protein